MDSFLALAVIVCVIGLSWFAGSDAPFIPTDRKRIKYILKLAGVKKGRIFYELGSGDGRVVFEASNLGAQAFGVEQSWIRIWYCRFLARRLKSPASFFHGNIFDRNYYPADVVYFYLLPKAAHKLEKKLKAELKKGAIVISLKYPFENWSAFKKVDEFYLYKK